MLAKEEQLNHFKGIKISRTSPSISQLLYADDLVIFCRANTDDATCINEVLNKFSVWSSQCANKEKSSIHFSNNTSHQTKLDITNILGFPECNHKTKHLGFSFCKPKSRKMHFLKSLIESLPISVVGNLNFYPKLAKPYSSKQLHKPSQHILCPSPSALSLFATKLMVK